MYPAKKSKLEAKGRLYTRLGIGGGLLVVGALIVEALVDSRLNQTTGALIALAVAAGVISEVLFHHIAGKANEELLKDSEDRVIELEKTAAEQRDKSEAAERTLTELKYKVEDRHLDEDRYTPLAFALAEAPKYSVTIFCAGDETSEPRRFATEIFVAFKFFRVTVAFENPEVVPKPDEGAAPTIPPGIFIRARDTETLIVWFRILEAAGIKGGAGREVPTLDPGEVQFIVTERQPPVSSFFGKPGATGEP